MKIGLVIERFDPRRGGAEGWTLQYAQRLLRRGHEVHVVTQQIGGAARGCRSCRIAWDKSPRTSDAPSPPRRCSAASTST